MTSDFRTQGQYRAAAQSIKDVADEARSMELHEGVIPLGVQATLAVALSNLAVAEAIHRVAEEVRSVGLRLATAPGQESSANWRALAQDILADNQEALIARLPPHVAVAMQAEREQRDG